MSNIKYGILRFAGCYLERVTPICYARSRHCTFTPFSSTPYLGQKIYVTVSVTIFFFTCEHAVDNNMLYDAVYALRNFIESETDMRLQIIKICGSAVIHISMDISIKVQRDILTNSCCASSSLRENLNHINN